MMLVVYNEAEQRKSVV